METRARRPAAFSVLLFSVLKEKIGQPSVSVVLDPPFTGGGLLDTLASSFPIVAAYRPFIRLAVNQEYVEEAVVLTEEDEIALITPVSGG